MIEGIKISANNTLEMVKVIESYRGAEGSKTSGIYESSGDDKEPIEIGGVKIILCFILGNKQVNQSSKKQSKGTLLIPIGEKEQSAEAWAKDAEAKAEFSYKTILKRYRSGFREIGIIKDIALEHISFEYNHRILTFREWSLESECDFSLDDIRDRYYRGGIRGEGLIKNIVFENLLYRYDNKTQTFREWSLDRGISLNDLKDRYDSGLRKRDLFREVKN